MQGKTCVITGANAGLGYETALNLASRGASVIMVCRSAEKGAQARQAIIASTGNQEVHVRQVDLASQQQIRDLGARMQSNNHAIDVLINNAGLVRSQWSLTEDRIETVFAVNHLAPFLLTHELLPFLKKAPEARVINVSSKNHFKSQINFEDLFLKKNYNGLKAYGQSKLANVLFTYELDRQVKHAGYPHITINAVDPGLNNTNIGNKSTNWWYRMVWNFRKKQGMEPGEGARTQIHLATSPELEGISGTYWQRSKTVHSSQASYREEDAKRLWELSLEMCKLDGYFL
jgi:NAD(P)-dependent dehydrogenase (short-subunit alcohol dehydrogenase family)